LNLKDKVEINYYKNKRIIIVTLIQMLILEIVKKEIQRVKQEVSFDFNEFRKLISFNFEQI
jgi:hypothetical protein